jgi:hypothetical protein
MGADDDLPDSCDDCWSAAHREDFKIVTEIEQKFTKFLSNKELHDEKSYSLL